MCSIQRAARTMAHLNIRYGMNGFAIAKVHTAILERSIMRVYYYAGRVFRFPPSGPTPCLLEGPSLWPPEGVKRISVLYKEGQKAVGALDKVNLAFYVL